jgi:hypothetical protein
MGAGKGDDYRRVDKKKFDKNYEAIFGKKDIPEFHKDKAIQTSDIENNQSENNATVM